MYEVTLSVEKANSHFLDYIYNSLSPCIEEIGGISACDDSPGRQYISFACADSYRSQMKKLIADLSAEVLSVGYKNIYLRQQLNVRGKGFLVNTLVNTMCAFDNNYDKEFVSRVINADEPLYFDGYYNFRLGKLKEKWREIAELTNSNNIILSDENLIKEFLSYLIEAIPCGVKQLSVVMGEGGFRLFDTGDKVITPTRSLSRGATAEEEAMLNAICLKPKKVLLYSDGNASAEFTDLMESLFEVKHIVNS